MTTPRMRAADDDRQQAAERLAEHYTAGRLNTQEYDERVARAYAVTFLDEMSGLFDDLPGAGRGRSSDDGTSSGRSGAFGGFDPATFGPAFGPALAKARAASRRAGGGGPLGRRGPGAGLPRVLAVALMVLLGFTAVVVIAHIIVPLFVIGLIAFLVTRGRRGGPRNRQGGPGGRNGQPWNGQPWNGQPWNGQPRNGPRQHWAA